MNHHSTTPPADATQAMTLLYRSEAFAEDLDDDVAPAPAWHPLERLVAAVPLLCVFAPVADAYLR